MRSSKKRSASREREHFTYSRSANSSTLSLPPPFLHYTVLCTKYTAMIKYTLIGNHMEGSVYTRHPEIPMCLLAHLSARKENEKSHLRFDHVSSYMLEVLHWLPIRQV